MPAPATNDSVAVVICCHHESAAASPWYQRGAAQRGAVLVLQERDQVDGLAKRGVLARLAEEEVQPRAPVLQELGVKRGGGDHLVRQRVEDDSGEGGAELVPEPREVGEPSLDAELGEPEDGHVGVDGDDVRGGRGQAVAYLDGRGAARAASRAGGLRGG